MLQSFWGYSGSSGGIEHNCWEHKLMRKVCSLLCSQRHWSSTMMPEVESIPPCNVKAYNFIIANMIIIFRCFSEDVCSQITVTAFLSPGDGTVLPLGQSLYNFAVNVYLTHKVSSSQLTSICQDLVM
jgi:hypothetical protein